MHVESFRIYRCSFSLDKYSTYVFASLRTQAAYFGRSNVDSVRRQRERSFAISGRQDLDSRSQVRRKGPETWLVERVARREACTLTKQRERPIPDRPNC